MDGAALCSTISTRRLPEGTLPRRELSLSCVPPPTNYERQT